MSIWFSKGERSGRTSRFSASITFTLVFVLIAVPEIATWLPGVAYD